MKHILLVSCCLCFLAARSQNGTNHFDRSWKSVDSLLQKKGLTKSALATVQKIYQQAKEEKNEGQLIKSLLYIADLKSQEEGLNETIQSFDAEAAHASPAAAALLRSIQADMLWNYLQQHRWQFASRTTVSRDSSKDIRTWTIDQFHQKIGALFITSLSPESVLQQTSLEPFDAVILKGNARFLRPTLFDLLAHRALDYFKNDEQDLSRPAYAFEFDDPAMFGDRETFLHTIFKTADTVSLHYRALLLMQKLLRFHEKDQRPDALVDVDIQRVVFVSQYAVMPDKATLYMEALERITRQYPALPAAAQAWYLQAKVYSDKASSYDPLNDTSDRYDYLQAKRICETVMATPDSSTGRTNCQVLFHQITASALTLQTEAVNLPDLPFRALVTYKNIQKIYGRIIRMDDATVESLQNIAGQTDFWKRLLRMSALRLLNQAIPDTKDYQQHKVEISIDALPMGRYALLASNDSAFGEKAGLTVQFFSTSRIAFVHNGKDYFVVDRDSGHPLKGVNVQSWYLVYDSKKGRDIYREGNHYTTDQNGYFRSTESKSFSYTSRKFIFNLYNDRLTDNESDIIYYRNRGNEAIPASAETYESKSLKVFLFTDRSIYRPGQTVFFKGIAVTKDFSTHQYKIVSGYRAKIGLFNANEIQTDSLQLLSNDFGSFHGSFTIPANQLNGEFSIQDSLSDGNQSFSVEAYKRPKFYVEYDKVKGTYHVGDSIYVSGNAKSYSGNTIDGATVHYRIIRQASYPYSWFSRTMPSSGELEIGHGTTVTDANGVFRIHFVAVPDLFINKESKPVFEYHITTDITDLNGESRNVSMTVPASYESFTLTIGLPPYARIPADSLHLITITSNNLSGEFERVKANVAIYRLQPPNRLIRNRYWTAPDQFVMDEMTYIRAFPNDEYNRETDKQFWKKIGKPVDETDSTESTGRFFTGKKYASLLSGWYLIETAAIDERGNKIVDKKYFEIMGKKPPPIDNLQYSLIAGEDQTAEPGQSISLQTGSAAADVFVIRTTDAPTLNDNDNRAVYSFFPLNQEIKTTSLIIRESDRGGFAVSDVFVKNNRFYSVPHVVYVPWSNKQLDISYETYRDKTLPGSNEQWKVKISGNRKDKAVAEVLTSMYDASLDQFKQHAWAAPDLFPLYDRREIWEAGSNFSAQASAERYPSLFKSDLYHLNYDILAGAHPGAGFYGNPSFEDVVVVGYGSGRRRINGIAVNELAFEAPAPGKSQNKLAVPKIAMDKMTGDEMFVTDTVAMQIKRSHEIKPAVQIRKNLNETAFFFPDLKTDAEGNVGFSFTMPEALTTWKWMLLAHTKEIAFGYAEKNIITQKELMLQPDMPRFFRAGDTMMLPVKIANLSGDSLTGSVSLQLLDASGNSSRDLDFQNKNARQRFAVAAGQSTVALFPVIIPSNETNPVLYRLIARTSGQSAERSDGEEAILPVLTNRMLVTESLPLNNPGSGTRTYTFGKLLHSGESNTLINQSLTVEYTANPAWYAVQSLPYLMEFPYECAEQTFNRFYANAVASMIVNRSPRIKDIFLQWKNKDTAALLSNLQKNEELKSILLRETPWVLNAAGETEQKKHIALLFDMVTMDGQLQSALNKLKAMQSEGGGFAWFKGGRDDRYITQYILSGVGHLKKLQAIPAGSESTIREICKLAMPYLDRQIKYEYEHIDRKLYRDMLTADEIQYLYMRSFFSDYDVPGDVFSALHYFRMQAIRLWPKQNMYLRGMIALFLYRTGDIKTAKDIMASLKENATVSADQGMYWASVNNGYYWQQAPVETQSLLIEAFNEISQDQKACDQMKVWLLQQKQTAQWATTKATADACYALLLKGSDWLSAVQSVNISMGDTAISSESEPTEAGTGYFKHRIVGSRVVPAMGNINLSVSTVSGNASPGYGSIYWQYFENLDKITAAKTSLSVAKTLYILKNTDRGPVLEPITESQEIHVGDKITVRLLVKSDRDMEYVQLKDMRAACFEPENVLSDYMWQAGLGYYQTTQDESTSFFFDHLSKGTYVLEYTMLTTASGHFSNGITTMGCMYAPAFVTHTEGIRVHVSATK